MYGSKKYNVKVMFNAGLLLELLYSIITFQIVPGLSLIHRLKT